MDPEAPLRGFLARLEYVPMCTGERCLHPGFGGKSQILACRPCSQLADRVCKLQVAMPMCTGKREGCTGKQSGIRWKMCIFLHRGRYEVAPPIPPPYSNTIPRYPMPPSTERIGRAQSKLGMGKGTN